ADREKGRVLLRSDPFLLHLLRMGEDPVDGFLGGAVLLEDTPDRVKCIDPRFAIVAVEHAGQIRERALAVFDARRKAVLAVAEEASLECVELLAELTKEVRVLGARRRLRRHRVRKLA